MPRQPRRTGRPRGRPRKAKGYIRPRARIYKRRLMLQNEPSFTETFQKRDSQGNVQKIGEGGGVFKVRISDIQQYVQDYSDMYTQYRINWVKVMILPDFNSGASDYNTATLNQANNYAYMGMGRIVYAIQDSPNVQIPASEAEVLQDNGCKIRAIGKYCNISFKPVPDTATVDVQGQAVPTKQYRKQWFNYVGYPNDPEHGAVQFWITDNTSADILNYNVYYKVNFSLRDPK